MNNDLFFNSRRIWFFATFAAILILVFVSIAFLVVSGRHVSTAYGKDEKKVTPEKVKPLEALKLFPVRISEANNQSLSAIRSYVGRLQELKKVTLSPEVGGILKTLNVEEGDKVIAGETVIAEIDTYWNELELKKAINQISLLGVQLTFQEKELDRMERLMLRNAATESELDSLRSAVDELKLQLEAANLTKEEFEEKIKRSKIYAPFDGHVVSKHAEIGQLLSPGTNIVDIVSSGEFDAVILIGEAFINRIKLGDKIPLIVETTQDEIFGEVINIVPYGLVKSRTFPVRLRIKDPEEKLKVNMSLEAFVTVTDQHQGIVVSNDAVLESPEGYTIWVAVSQDGDTAKVSSVSVKIDIKTPNQYLVMAETDLGKQLLVDGAKVVIEGAERLSENQMVRIIDINPSILENLPKASGHQTFNPQPRRTPQAIN